MTATRSPALTNRPMRRRVRALPAGLTLVLALGLGITTVGSTANASITCPANANVFVWDGSANDSPGQVGDGIAWDDGHNWSADCTPGTRDTAHDDDVTIPAGATVTLFDGESAQVAALHNNGTLKVTTGATLMLYGASQSSTLTLQGQLLGAGTLTVTKTLKWVSTASGAATQRTRWCLVESCTGPAPTPGRTVIAKGASLVISGRGVNLQDQRVIENHGATRISGAGYIAADYGTAFRNLRLTGDPVPTVVFQNDGGYYQGFSTAGFGLSAFANTGKVTKTGGTGVSIIDAAYSQTDPSSPFTGTVEVHSGSVSIGTPSGNLTRTAKVQQGASFGNGAPAACDPVNQPQSCQVVQPTTADPQVTTVQLTRTGTTTSTVSIQELPALAQPGDHGGPVQIDTPGAVSDVTHPLRFRLFVDASLLQPGETPASLAASAPVFRQATTTAPYAALPDCAASQNPTTALPVCVARTLSANETAALGNGDAVIVVSSLENSRYRL